MTDTPIFDLQLTEAVCNILAATEYPALSTSELMSALRPANLELDADRNLNKRTRLLHVVHNVQVRRGPGKSLADSTGRRRRT